MVVMIDGLGMPGRSKAYHDVTYRDLGRRRVSRPHAALQQLGRPVPVSRSQPGRHLRPLGRRLRLDAGHPCLSGLLSSRRRRRPATTITVWTKRSGSSGTWALPVGEHYREQANQSLAATAAGQAAADPWRDGRECPPRLDAWCVVDALIKANKDFDLLILPNLPHACDGDPYFVRKRWDYFVRHLFGPEAAGRGYRIEPVYAQ